MKRRGRVAPYALAFALVIGLAAAPAPLAAQEAPLVWGLVPNAPPTTYVDAAGKPTGFFIELYSRIMDELGISYSFRVGPFSELYPLLIEGKVDFFTTLVRNPEREKYFFYPEIAVFAGWSQLFIALDARLESVFDLQHKAIGVVADDRNGDNFRSYVESLALSCRIVEYAGFGELVEAVQKGEIFGGVQSNLFVSAEKRVQPTTIVFAPFNSYPVLSKNSVRRDEFEAIITRYSQLKDDPSSYYYELQRSWLGYERFETAVVPAWLIVGLVTLLLATVVSIIIIRVLTSKLRLANSELERKVAARSAMLMKAEKLAALGTLVSGLAHELNSPLQALLLAADSLSDAYEPCGEGEPAPLSQEERNGLALIMAKRGAGAMQADTRLTRRQLKSSLEGLGLEPSPDLIDRCLDIGLLEPDLEGARLLASASGPLLAAAKAAASRSAFHGVMTEAIARMSTVIKALRIYSHQDHKGEALVVSLPLQLDAVLALHANRLGSGIVLTRDYAGLPLYRCYADQLQQVWMNLVGNAIDAMGDAGALTIRGGLREDALLVSVEDTGPGIDPQLRQRVFEPFFTTKPEGSGTGLGLSIAHEIVRTHRGTLSFESRPGRTSFTVSLPLEGVIIDDGNAESLYG
jgi:signal transduction histidine kinase